MYAPAALLAPSLSQDSYCCEETPRPQQLLQGKIFSWSWLTVQRGRHGGKYGSMKADMVLEKELRVLHPDLQATGKELLYRAWLEPI